MISSLKSKFEFFNRRALLLSAHKAAVYHWRKGDIGSSYLFDADQEGRDYFARYLRESTNTPMHILIDVFEEEFRRDSIPHVFGPDRTAILQRKKARLFRETPFFFSRVQGREAEGRRDDRVLMSAVTNPQLVTPWLEMFDEFKVPVAGVYSLPLFTESMVKLLPHHSDLMLIVSLQSISGLRQTFIHKDEFRISRLVQMPRYGTTPYAPYIKEEVEKIRRYLNSLRLAQPEESLDIHFLATGDLLEELKKEYSDSGSTRYHFLDINSLMESSGTAHRVSAPFSDQLFVHQLLKRAPSNCYATPAHRRYFTLRKLRHSMLAASALLLLASAGWSGFNFMAGLSFKQRSMSADLKADFYSARYQMAKERLPQTPVEPRDLQVAVELADVLEQYKSSPLEMMRTISRALATQRTVQINSIDWISSIDPEAEPGGKKKAAGPASRTAAAFVPEDPNAPSYKSYQIAILNGNLSPFDGNFREAIATINNFAETIRTLENVRDVTVEKMPLDVSSDASLRGSTRSQEKSAVFSLKVVLGIGREA